jgi:hypothetical protein
MRTASLCPATRQAFLHKSTTVRGDGVMSENEKRKSAGNGSESEDKVFFSILLEDALVFPFGTECCNLDDFAEQ